MELQAISTGHLVESTWHHRTLWGDLTKLSESIREHGVIEPLIVRSVGVDRWEIVCGVRRYRAAKLINLMAVPCMVVELDDSAAIAMQVEENREREGMHPMDEALYFEDLSSRGMDNDGIARRFQARRRDVVRRLKLLSLSAKARKAFTAGAFDEESALSLATVDSARQHDILAAIDAGGLSADDITNYVHRTFMAQLDDVPWRMSDEALVPSAGSCTKCPKRSDAQRDLFAEESRGLKCLDVDCHRQKMDAAWQGTMRGATEGLVTVLDEPDHALFIPAQSGSRPAVMRSSGMVDEQGQCPHVPGLTWADAVTRALKPGADKPTVYVARDQDGRPRFLMRESIVVRMVKKSAAGMEAAAEKLAERDPVLVDEGAATRAEGKIRRAVVARFAELVVTGESDTWSWVAERCIRNAMPRTVTQVAEILREAIQRLEVPVADDMIALIELTRESNRQARRVATAVMIFEESDVVGEISPALHVLAASCDMDIATVERAVRSSAKKVE